MAIRIALVHSHFLINTGIRTLINANPGFELVVDSESLAECNRGHADVDVVIFNYRSLDSGIPNMSQFRKLFPNAKYLSISEMPSRFDVSEGLTKGISSFLLPECDKDEITEAIRCTSVSEQFFCGKILSQVMQSPDEALPASEYVCAGIRISAREAEIIRLVAEGLTNKEIADRLFLSAHTITTHRKNIMGKVGVNNTAGLVLFAIRNNIVTPNHFLFSPQ